jgi:hypothetical protein
MPRKKIFPELTPEDRFDDQVVEAIWATTIEQREKIARSFEAGQIAWLLATEIPGVTREALLITCLVDAESQLVFRGSRLRAKRLAGLVKVVSKLDQFRQTQSYPQISHSSVEKVEKSGDNSDLSVEKSAEKNPLSVENFPAIYASDRSEPDLLTSCGELSVFSTTPVENFPSDLQSSQSLFKDSCPGVIPDNLSTLSTGPTTTTIS